MKKIVLFLLLMSAPWLLYAQHTISGRVVNKQSGEVVEMATIRLFSYSGKDSTLIQGAQTDFDGNYRLSGIHDGQYKLRISSIGFKEITQAVNVSGQDVQVKTVRLEETVQHLAEVEVTGKAAEMTVKGDTLEYNTAAYKTQETDMVEDLLKKMNGVQVDSEGNITVNGESITSIRIDGKKFFGNDVQAATKNIPADMIDKIQVIDEKSDMAKLTGFEDDDTERIINLKLKEDKKKGLFGNYNAGLGADLVGDNQDKLFHYGYSGTPADKAKQFFSEDFRYNASAFMNILLGESQTTIIGSANNTNELRTGRGRGWGGGPTGITRAENLGVNTNIAGKNGYLYGGDMQLNHSSNDTRTKSEKEQWTDDNRYQQNDSSAALTNSWDVKTRLEFEFEVDSFNKVILKPEISYTNTYKDSYKNYDYARDSVLTTEGYQQNLGTTGEIGAKLQLIYNHKFQKPGRSLTLNADGNFTNNKGDSYNRSDNTSYTGSEIPLVEQWTQKTQNSFNYTIRASYVEPIWNNHHFIETALRFQNNIRRSEKNQYLDKEHTILDNEYSNALRNTFFSEALEVNYKWIDQYFDLTAGVRLNPSQTLNKTMYSSGLVRDTMIHVFNVAPNVTFRYKFGKKEFARIRYRGNSEQPSITQMEPVKDNSNAMNETMGNLDLKPAFRHRINFMYSKYNQDRFSSLTTGVFANLTKDALVSNNIYDQNGKLYQQTVNAKGTPFSVYANLMYNTPFANKLMQFHTRTSVGYNMRIAYVTREMSTEDIAQLIDENKWTLGDESRTGNVTVGEDMTIRLTHRIVDFGIHGVFNYSFTHNNLTSESRSNVFNWTLTGDLAFHLPKNWEIATDIGYTDRIGYGKQLGNLSEVMWNASLSKTWGFATLSVKAFDLLHQKKNIVQTVGENYIQYQRYNTLPTYAMLTFTYKLNRMGDMKAKGGAAFMQEMIESNADPSKGKIPTGPPPMLR